MSHVKNGSFDMKQPEGFDQLPIQVQMAVRKVIQRRVAERIHEEMQTFREELNGQINEIKKNSFVADPYYNAPYPPVHGYHPGYVAHPNAYFGHPGYPPRRNTSPQPKRS